MMKNMANKFQKNILSFSVIYEADPEGGYTAYVPALAGCHTQGETLEETEKNIKEAISVYLESLRSRNEKPPRETRVFQGRIEVLV